MKATYKAPEIDLMLQAFTGKSRVATIENDDCMTCSNPDVNFRDAQSRKEYTISGMCQACQDDIYGA